MSGKGKEREVPPPPPPTTGTLVAVTGATGFVGSHVVKELLSRSISVRAFTRDASRTESIQHLVDLARLEEGSNALPPCNLEIVSIDLSEDTDETPSSSPSSSSSSSSSSSIPQLPGSTFEPAGRINIGVHKAVLRPSEALRGCSAVVHCAATVSLGDGGGGGGGSKGVDGSAVSENHATIIAPTVGAAKAVLAGCAAAGVDTLVHVSSIAAVSQADAGRSGRGTNCGVDAYDESDWFPARERNDADVDPYPHAKALSELAVLEGRENKREGDATGAGRKPARVVSLCPSFVLGPLLSSRHASTSPRAVAELLRGKYTVTGIPRVSFTVVDVRDVARACADVALGEKGADGRRYILSNGTFWYSEIAEFLRRIYPNVSKREAWDWLVRAAAAVGAAGAPAAFIRRRLGVKEHFNNARAREELGIEFRDPVISARDTARSLVELGVVDDLEAPVDKQWDDDDSK